MTEKKGNVGILVGGGPAPGINSVIGAATIRASLAGFKVIGIREGFRYLMEGDTSHIEELTIEKVSRFHFRGGSDLSTARANPTKKQETLDRTVQSLTKLGIDKLITIGGDDTLFSAHKVAEAAGNRIAVVHVPKTIDNDLDLPQSTPTFGYETARHLGCALVKNLMTDAKTTTRWYFVIAMGRKAGHLALGIGKAVGATVTLIPEEFPEPKLELRQLVDTLTGSLLKRRMLGRPDGVAVIAEGLIERLTDKDLHQIGALQYDEHGHIRFAEVEFGRLLKAAVEERCKQLGFKPTIVAKDIGYELRCADPIPFDMEYTRDLGYSAAKYLLEGGTRVMIALIDGKFRPFPFDEMMDPTTGRTRVRMVDINCDRYRIARRYMLRLRRDDFADPRELGRLAGAAHLTSEEFRRQFEYLTAHEPPPIDWQIATSSDD